MATLIEFDGKRPVVSPSAYIAPTAVLIGDVVVEDEASVWWGAVLRADFSRIHVGRGSCIQDNCVLHTDVDMPTVVGNNVAVGHNCTLEGCVVEDDALVGMGSILLHGTRVGRGSLVAAGSVLREGFTVPAATLAAGVPAVLKGELGDSSQAWVRRAAAEYRALRLQYLDPT